MIRNFFIVTFRNFLRNGLYSFINVGGLALGFASAILIVLFVLDELKYDRHHEYADRIFRINARGVIGNTVINQTSTCAPLPAVLINDYPEVENAVRMMGMRSTEIRHKDIVFIEDQVASVDSTFLEIFSLEVTRGNAEQALSGTHQMMISESAAKRYFGNADPMGKILRINDEEDFEIRGVFRDMPRQSHFHFDFLLTLFTYDVAASDQWMSNMFSTYLLLHPGANAEGLEAKFPELIRAHVFSEGDSWEQFTGAGNSWEYFLQPLTAIHLTSDLNGEFEANGNLEYIYIFLVAAAFIILIAAVNFTNLTTAKSEKRAREVGIRKVLGSSRQMLIRQFLWESVITSLLALLIAYMLVIFLIDGFNVISGKEIYVQQIMDLPFLLISLLTAMLIGVLAGLYPSFYLSSFRPSVIMKSAHAGVSGRSPFRGFLVVFQFFISISLIIGTLVVYRQLDYFQNKDLGYKKDRLIVIQGTEKLGTQSGVFRNKIDQYSQVKKISGSNWVPGRDFYNWGVIPEGFEDNWLTLNVLLCDTSFLETFGMQMEEGRFFSASHPSDSGAMILNENAAALMGWEDPIGKKIRIWGQFEFEVIGVIRDFHYESLHQKIRPMALITFPFQWERIPGNMTVKVSGEQTAATVAYIEEQWHVMAHGLPFRYSFIDQDYESLYMNETNTGRVFLLFSVLAIIIASLGLFALSSYMIEQRTREIGIRKVNGASVAEIVWLLMRDFTRWIMVAIILAIPVALFGMNRWLENFAYRTNIPLWILVSAAVIGLVIAWLTISMQTIRASCRNPAEILKYE